MNETMLIERIRRLSRPLEHRPTELAERLTSLPGVRAVLFDIYGTLFISAVGDIGVGLVSDGDQAFREALKTVGLPPVGGADLLTRAIQAEHDRKRGRGIAHPEVDIAEIWRQVVTQLGFSLPGDALRQLVLEYELRVNPVWPMPGLGETLESLRFKGVRLGLLSNAQFYTPLLFPAFLQTSIEELGFEKPWCVFSWRLGVAKPSRVLYDQAARALVTVGITPGEVLYVGNDCLNDMWPAAQAGFHTGLFAGDARSLRLRENNPRCQAIKPDCVFKHLAEILQVIE